MANEINEHIRKLINFYPLDVRTGSHENKTFNTPVETAGKICIITSLNSRDIWTLDKVFTERLNSGLTRHTPDTKLIYLYCFIYIYIN